jgi:hypothetical protein
MLRDLTEAEVRELVGARRVLVADNREVAASRYDLSDAGVRLAWVILMWILMDGMSVSLPGVRRV